MPPKANFRKNEQGSSSGANAADSCASGAADEANPKPSNIKRLLDDIRSEVCASRTKILNKLKTSVSILQTTLQAHELKLQEVGDSLTDVDARVVALESLCSGLTQETPR